jgi:bifunctional non-homologous end joining protein LigD
LSAWSKRLIEPLISRFVIHYHKTARPHYDLRVVMDRRLRSWSLLKEPPRRVGERRLAIERESFPVEAASSPVFEEEAFGRGPVIAWDEGEVEIGPEAAAELKLRFAGSKMTGTYRLRRMRWYPGNQWMFSRIEP